MIEVLFGDTLHLVLHVDADRAQSWSSDEVIERWLALYSGPAVAKRYKAGQPLAQHEQNTLDALCRIPAPLHPIMPGCESTPPRSALCSCLPGWPFWQ